MSSWVFLLTPKRKVAHFVHQTLDSVVLCSNFSKNWVNQNKKTTVLEYNKLRAMSKYKRLSPDYFRFFRKFVFKILTIYLIIPFSQIFVGSPCFH